MPCHVLETVASCDQEDKQMKKHGGRLVDGGGESRHPEELVLAAGWGIAGGYRCRRWRSSDLAQSPALPWVCYQSPWWERCRSDCCLNVAFAPSFASRSTSWMCARGLELRFIEDHHVLKEHMEDAFLGGTSGICMTAGTVEKGSSTCCAFVLR